MSKDIQLINASLKDTNGKPLNLTIRDGSVTNSKLANDSVSTDKIQNEAVTEEKISQDTLKSINDKASEASNEAAAKADEAREKMEQTMDSMKEVIDSSAIKDDEGNLVPSPFKYVQNDEFIFAMVDAEDKLLAGIQWDGTPVHGKTSSVEDRMQSQIDLIANRVATIMGDEDTTNVIDTMNELKAFFANIENTETLTGILANLDNVAKNLDKTTIKDEEGNVQDTPFKVIENEEFIHAITDSEDRLLFGIYRETGKPYFPLNEMYHVEQNEEFFAVWLDAEDHVLLGIRRDGEIIGEIHACNALKQVVSQLQSDVNTLQEKVGTIDTSLQELLSVFSLQDNEEYLAVEEDAEGKVLSATNPDGSHYIHKVKSETIPEEFEHIEDPEGRMEITTDAEGKVLSERKEDGSYYNYVGVKSPNIDNLECISNKFCLSTHSSDIDIELEEPRIAEVRLYAQTFPSSKTDDSKGQMVFITSNSYFERNVLINLQGSTSLNMAKKNIAVDIMNSDYSDSLKVKFGDWVSQDSYHMKGYYFDLTKGVAPSMYALYKQIEESRDIENDRPYKAYKKSIGHILDKPNVADSFDYEPLCHPMGFPCMLYYNDEFYGLMSFQLKKHRDNYAMDKKSVNHIHLDGVIDKNTLLNGNISWGSFEIRNPKSLITINGESYNGDNPTEIIGENDVKYDSSNKNHVASNKVKTAIIQLSTYKKELDEYIATNASDINGIKKEIEKRFNIQTLIDYLLFIWIGRNTDSTSKNWQWLTYDGVLWCIMPYDLDSCWGIGAALPIMKLSDKGLTFLFATQDFPLSLVYTYYKDELKQRWAELRDKSIVTKDNIFGLYYDWYKRVGIDNIKKELARWDESPCYRSDKFNSDEWKLTGSNYITYYAGSTNWVSTNNYSKGTYIKYKNRCYKSLVDNNVTHIPTDAQYWEDVTYVDGKTYSVGDKVYWGYAEFFECECLKETSKKPFELYTQYPYELGCGYESIDRIYRFIKNTIAYLDTQLNYKL